MTKAELLHHLAALPDDAQIYLMPIEESTYADHGLVPIQLDCHEADGPNNEYPAFGVISWRE